VTVILKRRDSSTLPPQSLPIEFDTRTRNKTCSFARPQVTSETMVENPKDNLEKSFDFALKSKIKERKIEENKTHKPPNSLLKSLKKKENSVNYQYSDNLQKYNFNEIPLASSHKTKKASTKVMFGSKTDITIPKIKFYLNNSHSMNGKENLEKEVNIHEQKQNALKILRHSSLPRLLESTKRSDRPKDRPILNLKTKTSSHIAESSFSSYLAITKQKSTPQKSEVKKKKKSFSLPKLSKNSQVMQQGLIGATKCYLSKNLIEEVRGYSQIGIENEKNQQKHFPKSNRDFSEMSPILFRQNSISTDRNGEHLYEKILQSLKSSFLEITKEERNERKRDLEGKDKELFKNIKTYFPIHLLTKRKKNRHGISPRKLDLSSLKKGDS